MAAYFSKNPRKDYIPSEPFEKIIYNIFKCEGGLLISARTFEKHIYYNFNKYSYILSQRVLKKTINNKD